MSRTKRIVIWQLALALCVGIAVSSTPTTSTTADPRAYRVQGNQDDQTAPSGMPLTVAGLDTNGNARLVKTDANGNLFAAGLGGGGSTQIEGRAAAGTAVTGNPLQAGLSDGTNIQYARQVAGSIAGGTGVAACGMMVRSAGGTLFPVQTGAVSDGDNGGSSIPGVIQVFNGSTFDRLRTAGAAAATTGTGLLGVNNLLWDGTNYQRWQNTSSLGDASSLTSGAITDTRVYNGNTWDRGRTPTIFKTVTATASGNTTVWTPTGGKKFRLMRYRIEVTNDAKAAAGADLEITLNDSGSALNLGSSTFIPTASATTFGPPYSSGWCDLGNGVLSAVANNLLQINLSFALTGGEVRIQTAGTEE